VTLRLPSAARRLLLLLLPALLAGCGARDKPPTRAPAVVLPVEVLADTARNAALPVPPPAEARAWLERVSRAAPARAAAGAPVPEAPPARPRALELPPPEARPEAPPVSREPTDVLVYDDDLHPPIPIGSTPLREAGRGRVVGVDLDVRIDESGGVSDAVWAGGSEDTLAVAAATECALAMRFHPALQHGRPVAVWCRQHFEFGRGGARVTPADGESR